MLFNLRKELNRISWGIVLICFSILVLIHFILHEFSPLERDLIQNERLHGTNLSSGHLSSDIAIGDDEELDFDEVVGTIADQKPGNRPEPHNPVQKNPAMYPKASDEEYVAICMAVKDQVEDLSEALVHHYHHLGIRRFYLMDDESEPPLSTYRNWGIPREHITFHYYNRTTDRVPNMQDTVYSQCIALYRERHTWMAFLDADEMLEMTGEETLTQLLKRLEKNRSIGALAISWLTHTSNGHLHRQESIRKAFTDCIWDAMPTHNYNVKAIGKTEFHAGAWGIHQIHLAGGTHTVDEHGFEVTKPFRNPTRERIGLHHYAIKSKEEFEEKISRSNAMDQPKNWNFWNEVEAQGGIPCPSMALYEP